MKICSCPDDVPYAEPNYASYDTEKEKKRAADHEAALKKWLISAGYTGKHTGKVYQQHVADGYACYMMADGGTARKSFLIHLPYWDAYHAPDVEYVPYQEIVRRLEGQKKIAAIFS